MKLLRYYQTGEESAWLPLDFELGDDWEAAARSKGAKKATILALTRPVDEYDSDYSAIQYLGPFYMDIDVKPEEVNGSYDRALEVGIESLQGILNELIATFKVRKQDLHVFLSGKKGFHLTIPRRVFGLTAPISNLPKIYKHMASYFLMPGVDYQVYSAGKGVSWRLTEIIREGTEIKRTAIPFDMAMSLTPTEYKEAVASPSSFRHGSSGGPTSRRMKQHFERALTLVNEDLKAQDSTPLTHEDLDTIRSETPPCVKHLISSKELKVRGFNAAALQVMIYLKATGQNSSVVSNIINRFVEVRSSSRFGSAMEAKKALKDIYGSVVRTNKEFGCAYMKSSFIAPRGMCQGCALTEARKGASGVGLQVTYHNTGTFLTNVDKDSKIMLFPGVHLKTESELINPDNTVAGISFTAITLDTNRSKQISISAEDYSTPSMFMKALRAQGVVCTGEVFKVQADILAWFQVEIRSDMDKREETDVVQELGLYVPRNGDKTYWITPENTFECNGMMNTVHLHLPQAGLFRDSIFGKLTHPTRMSEDVKKILGEALLHSFKIRQLPISATLMGWSTMCWLNPYLKTIQDIPPEFPILRVTGTTGSGKTTLLRHFVKITGLQDRISLMFGGSGGGSSIVGGSHAMASSKSLPIIWEEVNSTGSEAGYASKLKDFLEAVKNSWNGDQIVKSAGAGSTGVSAYSMTNPVVMLGEVEASTESLNHRSIWLYLDRIDTSDTKKYVAAYEKTLEYVGPNSMTYQQVMPNMASIMFFFLCERSRPDITRLILEGRTRSLQIVRMLAEEHGAPLDARKLIAIASVVQGLDLLATVMEESGMIGSAKAGEIKNYAELVTCYQLGVAPRGILKAMAAGATKVAHVEPEDIEVMSSRESIGTVRLTDGQQLLQHLLLHAAGKMQSASMLNLGNFRPVREGEQSMFVRRGGYLVVNAGIAFSVVTSSKINNSSLNFGASSLADFTLRLAQMRDKNSRPFELRSNEIAISLETLEDRKILDVADFQLTCATYLEKLQAYNPDLGDESGL